MKPLRYNNVNSRPTTAGSDSSYKRQISCDGIYRQSPLAPRQRGFAQSRSVDLLRQRSVEKKNTVPLRSAVRPSYSENRRYQREEEPHIIRTDQLFLQTLHSVAESLRGIETQLASINSVIHQVNDTLSRTQEVRNKTPLRRNSMDDSACFTGLNDSLSLSVSQVDGHMLDDTLGRSPKLFGDSAGQYPLEPIDEGRSSQDSARSNLAVPYV